MMEALLGAFSTGELLIMALMFLALGAYRFIRPAKKDYDESLERRVEQRMRQERLVDDVKELQQSKGLLHRRIDETERLMLQKLDDMQVASHREHVEIQKGMGELKTGMARLEANLFPVDSMKN